VAEADGRDPHGRRAQVPLVSNDAVAPSTMRAVDVVEVKLTVRPELAVAVKRRPGPQVCVGMVGKMMV
jgi:hypothetical protein